MEMNAMEAFSNYKVAVLDDDERIVETVTRTIRGWGLCVEGFTQPDAAFENIRVNKCDIILLDIFAYGVCAPRLVTQREADTKIIIMTEFADKARAIKALELGAFDLIEKPLQNDLLRHSILRALKALGKERESKVLIDELKQSRSELVAQQQRLETLNAQLLETNRALSIFAQNVEREREEIGKRVALKLKSIILPIVANLKNDAALNECETQLNILTLQIEDVTSGFGVDPSVAMTLSSAEMRIASLIKNGVATEKIAAHLHITENTVRTHRKNIRRKLKISKQHSLRNYLNSRSRPVYPATFSRY